MSLNNSGSSINSKLDALRSREASLKAAIATEKVRQQKRDEKDTARLFSIIGAALVQNAAKHPDFELMLKGVLRTATTFNDSEKNFLKARGWL